MPWERGNQSAEVELSRVQDKLERWSEDLDGEHGVIREFRDEMAERRATVKILKGVVGVLGAISLVQTVLAALRIAHVI